MEDNVPLKTLKASEIGNMICDFYDCASKKDRRGPGSIDMWLRYCKMPEYANPVYEMRKLPYDSPEQKYFKSNKIKAATLSCTCGGKRRSQDNVVQVNPLVVIDIDYHPGKDENKFLLNRAEKLDLMDRLINTGYVYACGSSCRGTGIWAIFVLATTDIERHLNALIDDFKKFNIELDSSCRDVTRLRFASPDDIKKTHFEVLKCYQKKKEGEKEQEVKKVQPYRSKPDFALKYDKERYSIPEIIDTLLALGYRTEHYEPWCFGAMFHLLPFGQEGLEEFVKITLASNEVRQPGDYRTERQAREKFARNSCTASRFTPDECYRYWKYILEHFQSPQNKQNLTSQ